MANKNKAQNASISPHFPPVVAVLGHVDHGKTTLLDAIRKSNIATREIGGITQGIGASSIEVMHDGKKQRITFIDTPGHQTFSAMRSRGAQVADIGLLIVSATDGVMLQTRESIAALTASKMPIIVVLTKVDLPDKNIEKVKQQLLKENILLEGLGGDVPVIEVSAKTNKNVAELLDLILLVFEMHADMFANRTKDAAFSGTIIESKLDQKVGSKATMIIKNGTMRVRDMVVAGDATGKIRGLVNTEKKQIQEASIGDAVEVVGFTSVPSVGSIVSLANAKEDSRFKIQDSRSQETASLMHHDENALSIILVTDTIGSLEAIVTALPKEIVVLLKKTGDITVSDVFLAKSTKSILVGFNARVQLDVVNLAKTEKILLKNYTIIYELLDELKDVMDGKALALVEEIYGKAKVLASFPFEKTKVLGITVLEGRVAKGDRVRLIRGEEIIGESVVNSVRQGKNQISKIEQGKEGGIILSPLLDFTIGDMILCHR